MRLRRLVAILFISLANMLMLVHAVIPHYHHDGIVCFDTQKAECCSYSECAEDVFDIDGVAETNHHSHTESCNLFQLIERNGNVTDDNLTLPEYQSYFLDCVCTLCNNDLLFQEQIVISKHKHYIKHKETYISPYVGSQSALRAPPTISL